VRGMGGIKSELQFSGFGTLINQGLISADVSGQTLAVNPDVFTNEGTARAINGATLNITTPFTQTAGSLTVNASTITSNSALQINGGALTGFGQINAAIQNNALLRPGLGGTGLNVTGNVTLLGASQLSFQLGGLTQGSQYGFLNVNGTVALNGTLLVSFVNSFQAASNNNFTVLTANSAPTGSFTNVPSGSRVAVTSGGSFLVTYGGTTNIVLSDFQASVPGNAPVKAKSSDSSASGLTAPAAALASADDAHSSGSGRMFRTVRTRAPRTGIALQNTDQLHNLMEGTNATKSAGGVLVVHPAPAARAGKNHDFVPANPAANRPEALRAAVVRTKPLLSQRENERLFSCAGTTTLDFARPNSLNILGTGKPHLLRLG
ncbi:MAG: hypothetical protein ACR2MW_11770, partial [Chthoniobacterales bacterium]